MLSAGEDRSSAGDPTGGSGDRKRTQNTGFPDQHARSLLTGISGEEGTRLCKSVVMFSLQKGICVHNRFSHL